jgi:hypothetical protein
MGEKYSTGSSRSDEQGEVLFPGTIMPGEEEDVSPARE